MVQDHTIAQPVQALSDVELIQAIQQRRENAFHELQSRYAPGIRAYAFREARSLAEADFLVDRVFNHIWNGAVHFDAEVHGVVHTWVYALARSACSEFFRPRRRKSVGTTEHAMAAIPG
jgi:DNA-directed RNA polymerase specialized sigma24 family protein